MSDTSYLDWPFLDDMHRDLASRIARWSEAEIAPIATDYDVDPRFPHELFQKLADSGLTGAPFP